MKKKKCKKVIFNIITSIVFFKTLGKWFQVLVKEKHIFYSQIYILSNIKKIL